MIRKNDYFRLGVFIIVGLSMLIAVIIILGAGRYFQKTFPLETYLDESVNGLAVGSPVKLRGVMVGRVAEINFVTNKYPGTHTEDIRYVYVECDIDPDLFEEQTEDDFRQMVDKDVARGLRMRPTSLGLTGQLFLDISYADPDSNPPLPINWKPQHAYIPSVPSTLSRIEDAISTISKTLSSLKQEDIESIISDVKSIVNTLNEFMKTEGGREAGKQMLSILDETHGILQKTNSLLADPAVERILPETAGAAEAINRILTESSDDLIAAAAETKEAMTSFKQAAAVVNETLSDPRMDTALDELAPTLENISKASKDMTAAVTKVHTLINRLNGVVASEEANIHAILEDAREVMQNIKELSGDAKRYPSGMIFGAPPAKPNPEVK